MDGWMDGMPLIIVVGYRRERRAYGAYCTFLYKNDHFTKTGSGQT
jgi:hypothetical protein